MNIQRGVEEEFQIIRREKGSARFGHVVGLFIKLAQVATRKRRK
jgi:hypothetical protein